RARRRSLVARASASCRAGHRTPRRRSSAWSATPARYARPHGHRQGPGRSPGPRAARLLRALRAAWTERAPPGRPLPGRRREGTRETMESLHGSARFYGSRAPLPLARDEDRAEVQFRANAVGDDLRVAARAIGPEVQAEGSRTRDRVRHDQHAFA